MHILTTRISTGIVYAFLGFLGIGCALGSSDVVVHVDTAAETRSINPDIYGISVSSGGRQHFAEMGVSVVRWGGNARTRFNWEINASNAASDFEFRNLKKGDSTPGSAALEFHAANQTVGAKSILTIPLIGWVAKDNDEGTRSIDVPHPDDINGYDATDNRARTSVASFARKGGPFEFPPVSGDDTVYQDEWVYYLSQTLGTSDTDGMEFYELGNEPMLWSDTHVDIHPERVGYEAYLDKFVNYASAIKDVDSSARLLAPSVSGWQSYFYSTLDKGDDNFNTAQDRKDHGNTPFLPWFLNQIQGLDAKAGIRTLDYLAIHYFPQGGVFSKDTSAEIQGKRVRSTRSLWDANYRDESWISRTDDGPYVRLIPRMRGWIDQNYPGTKLAITEWNWGGNNHISGGIAAADVLGIFGREGVDLATHWGDPGEGSPVYWAFRMFRNFDGQGGRFGDLSLPVKTNNPDAVTAYASRDSQSGRFTLLLINKLAGETTDIRLELEGLSLGDEFAVYRYTNNRGRIVEEQAITLDRSTLSMALPPYSLTLLVSD